MCIFNLPKHSKNGQEFILKHGECFCGECQNNTDVEVLFTTIINFFGRFGLESAQLGAQLRSGVLQFDAQIGVIINSLV